MDILQSELLVLPLLVMAVLLIRLSSKNARLENELSLKREEVNFLITTVLLKRHDEEEPAKEEWEEEAITPPSALPTATARYRS